MNSLLLAVGAVSAAFLVLGLVFSALVAVADWLDRKRPAPPRRTTFAKVDDELARRRALRAVNRGRPLTAPERSAERVPTSEYVQ